MSLKSPFFQSNTLFSTRFAPHMVCTRFTLTGCCNLFDFGY
nr:MAG TPA: hypothetical protein [Caudoviricetes sp.]